MLYCYNFNSIIMQVNYSIWTHKNMQWMSELFIFFHSASNMDSIPLKFWCHPNKYCWFRILGINTSHSHERVVHPQGRETEQLLSSCPMTPSSDRETKCSETCLHWNPFWTWRNVRFRQVFVLGRLKKNENLYKGTKESVWLRQVSGFLSVQFGQHTCQLFKISMGVFYSC